MKNKKRMFITIGIIILLSICVIFCISAIKNNSRYKTTDDLFKGLTKAINNTDQQAIIKCFPDFIQKSLPTLSNKSIEDFHNKVGDIHFNIIKQNSVESKDKENEINSKYNCNIKLEEYDLVICKYHEGFSETTFEVIKIDGRWYLYYYSYFPEPLQYFVE